MGYPRRFFKGIEARHSASAWNWIGCSGRVLKTKYINVSLRRRGRVIGKGGSLKAPRPPLGMTVMESMDEQTVIMKHMLIVFLLVPLASVAQESAAYRTCNDKATTQMEMNTCAGEEAARVDARLNDVYHELLSTAGKRLEAVVKIKAAEKSWVAYRDAYMEAMYPAKDKQVEYGSIYLMEASLLRAKLTERHTTELKELLQQYSGEGR